MIQQLRENIYDLRDYLWRSKPAHTCTHPLYSINDRLTLDHFEKLFNTFETMNGRNKRGNELPILEDLSRQQFDEIADRHQLRPCGETPG